MLELDVQKKECYFCEKEQEKTLTILAKKDKRYIQPAFICFHCATLLMTEFEKGEG